MPAHSLLGQDLFEVLDSKLNFAAHFYYSFEELVAPGQTLRLARCTSLDVPGIEPLRQVSNGGIFGLPTSMRYQDAPTLHWASLHTWRDLVIEPICFFFSLLFLFEL